MNLSRVSKVERPGGQVFLAAFGKHPGWDDHIEDIGVETEHLAWIKQLLYVQGIGGAIDAGTWDDLTAPQRVAGFEHVLICRTAGDLVVARLWSSTDGKGRSRYPMVVCVQCGNLPLAWVLREVLPELERIEARCKAAATAAEVIAIADEARQDLRQLAALAETSDVGLVADPADLAALADRPEMLDGREGFLRILYQLEREAANYDPESFATVSRDGTPRAVQMRVPACGDAPAEIIPRWLSFLMLRLDPAVEVWAICRDGRNWLDVIIGEPSPSQFFCFQASREALPLASEIPYTLDDAFRRRAGQLIDDAKAGRAKPVMVKPAAAPTRIGKEPGEQRLRSPGRAKTLRIALIAAAVVAAIVAVIVALIALAPGTSPKTPAPAEGAPGRSAMTPARQQAWRDLCMESYKWFAPFLADANESRVRRWQGDEHLAATVLPVLTRSFAGELVLDPRQIAAVSGRHLRNLAESPPPGAESPEGIEKTARAVEALATIRQALSADAWPALGRLKALAPEYRQCGWQSQADYLRDVISRAESITSPDLTDAAPDLPSRIDEVLAAAGKVDEIEDLWAELQGQAETLKASGNAVLARFGEYAAAHARSATGRTGIASLARLAGRLKDARSLGEPLVAFVGDDWQDKVDMPTVAKDPLLSGPVSPEELADGQIFLRWLASIRSERFARLDPAADPRARDDWAERQARQIEALAAKIDELRTKYSAAEAGALRARLSVVEAERKKLLAMPWDREHKGQVTEDVAALTAKVPQLSRQVGTALAQAAGGREAYVANIPRTVSGSAEVNKYWQGRIAELTKLEDMTRLTTKVEKLEEDLVKLDRSLPRGLAAAQADKDWNRVLAEEAASTRREEAMGKLLAALEWKDGEIVRGRGFEVELRKVSDGLENWKVQAAEVMTAFNAIDDALRRGAGLDESPGGAGGKTLAQLVADFEARPIWKDRAVVDALAPVTRRVERLRKITGMADPAAVAGEAAAMATDRFEAARAAWKRLGQLPGWPATPEQFNVERSIHRDLSNVYSSLVQADAARGKQLADELTAGVRARWRTYFLAGTDPARIDAAVARMGQYFLDANTAAALSPACAFRLALRDLRRDVLGGASAAGDDQAVRRRVRQFVASARRIGRIAGEPAAVKLMDELAAVAEAKDEGADLTQAGPAQAGWKPAAGDDGRAVTFTPPDGTAAALRFVRVEPPGRPAGYLCTTETPVGLFLRTVGNARHWPQSRQLLRTFDSPEADMRMGPRAWTVGAGGAPAVAGEWVRLPLGFAKKEFYYAGAQCGSPSADSPLQYVSASAAVYFARLLGCRLPTAAEWSAAKAASKRGAAANLRDATWAKQKAHIQKLEEAGRLSVPEDHYPDAGAFWPAGAKRITGAEAKAAASDDGVLWFAPVGAADGDGFRHLVGNVAELTFEKPEALAEWSGEAGELKRLLRAAADSIRVIGGSALSAPAIGVDKPQPVDYAEIQAGCADVGIRLAFTAPAETVRARVRRLLTEAGYPKAVARNR